MLPSKLVGTFNGTSCLNAEPIYGPLPYVDHKKEKKEARKKKHRAKIKSVVAGAIPRPIRRGPP